MTEAMPFLQKYNITFLRPPTIWTGLFLLAEDMGLEHGRNLKMLKYSHFISLNSV